MQILGYYTNSACVQGMPPLLSDGNITKVIVEEQGVVKKYDPSILTSPIAARVQVSGESLTIKEQGRTYSFLKRPGPQLRYLYNVPLTPKNLRLLLDALGRNSAKIPSYHLSMVYYSLRRELAQLEVDPNFQAYRGKTKEAAKNLQLEGRYTQISGQTVRELSTLVSKWQALVQPSQCPKGHPAKQKWTYHDFYPENFPPGNFLYGTVALFGERALFAEFWHELIGHGTEPCLAEAKKGTIKQLWQQAAQQSIKYVARDYIGPERVYAKKEGQKTPKYFLIKNYSLLRLFSEYTYQKKDPLFPQFEAIGHPQDSWPELRASALAVVMGYRAEFLKQYNKLPATQKQLAREIVQVALASVGEDAKIF